MTKFEQLLLNFAKFTAAAAPAVAPIFIHSPRGVLIFNASEALTEAAVETFQPKAPTS